MGFLNKKADAPAQEPKRDPSPSSGGSETTPSQQERVTLLACALGAIAAIGGFIFGYVR
jgi:SP family sugar:H+ symporter-like MFS transporter